MQVHGSVMSFTNPEATRLARKKHWGNTKLTSKTKGSSVSTKTKEVIVEGNVDTRKITHLRKNGIVHLTKRTEKMSVH